MSAYRKLKGMFESLKPLQERALSGAEIRVNERRVQRFYRVSFEKLE